jgi:ankyrin repeat protein
VNANEAEKIGETTLCLAVQRDYPEMVELLLKNGANPDITGWMGLSARLRARRRKDEDGKKIMQLIEIYSPSKLAPGSARQRDA